MIGLTHCQRELLVFFRAHVKAHGITPSFNEARLFLGLRSNSSVTRIVSALEDKGYIRRLSKRARGIELLKTEDEHLSGCNCDGCAKTRFALHLKLFQAVNVEPPIRVLTARADNFRRLPDETRAAILGIQPSFPVACIAAAVPTGAQ